ncbi:sensor histidine kinase [Zhouia sp. PK063]|uniref:sensor histidine kinase n=1 Tax=Zhouia sp. PK063 TaxID=3373602 RepID=UPI00378D82CD
MKKLLVLILILIAIDVVVYKNAESLRNTTKNENAKIKDANWEYIKDRLFSGNGSGEFIYKVGYENTNCPILFDLVSPTVADSIAVEDVIKKLRTIIPNRKFAIFKNYVGRSYAAITYKRYDDEHEDKPFFVKGISYYDIANATVKFSFDKDINPSNFEDIVNTNLPDGSSIERTNDYVKPHHTRNPSKVWFHLKDSLDFEKRKQYIQYEMLRTLCYIYPNTSNIRWSYYKKGIFFTPSYIPDSAELTHADEFLLKKLYESDFLAQFKNYLTTQYSWLYAIKFLNKSFSITIAWATVIGIGLLVFLLLLSFYQKTTFKYSYLNYFVSILFIMLYYVHFTYLCQYITDGGSTFLQWENILYINFNAIITAVGEAFILWGAEKKWVSKIENFGFKISIKVVLTFLVLNTPVIILIILQQDLNGFVEFYLPTFIVTVILALGRGLLIYLKHFADNLVKQKDLELSKLKEVNAQAHLKLLHSQINPHFLYNALNSIAGLATVDGEKTEKMALSLSDLFKYTINRKEEKFSSIKDELEMVNNYLEVEQIRFGERLQFHIECDKDLENVKIPRFLIQPLIENAVKHGISKIEGKGYISLAIHSNKENMIIKVTDSGPEFQEGLVSGYGLQSVYDLLELSYGNKAQLSWSNTPEKHISIFIKQSL